jgi:hypothetical protein
MPPTDFGVHRNHIDIECCLPISYADVTILREVAVGRKTKRLGKYRALKLVTTVRCFCTSCTGCSLLCEILQSCTEVDTLHFSPIGAQEPDTALFPGAPDVASFITMATGCGAAPSAQRSVQAAGTDIPLKWCFLQKNAEMWKSALFDTHSSVFCSSDARDSNCSSLCRAQISVLLALIFFGPTAPCVSWPPSWFHSTGLYPVPSSTMHSLPRFLTSCSTESSHLNPGLPFFLLPSVWVKFIYLEGTWSSILVVCRNHFNLAT